MNPNLDQRLREALEEELQRRTRELQQLLLEARQIDGWMGVALSSELKTALESRQTEVAVATLRCLCDWQKAGGELRLSLHRSPGEAPRVGSAARVAAPAPTSLGAPPLTVPGALPPPAGLPAPGPSVGPGPVPARAPVRPLDARNDVPWPSTEGRLPTPVDPWRGRVSTPMRPETPTEVPTDVGDPPTEESVAKLADFFKSGSGIKETPSVDWRAELMIVLASLQLGGDDETEADRVYRGIRECDRWKILPRDIQRGLVGMCAARLRRLQDERGCTGVRLEESFSRLSAYSKREQPGFVFGLSRQHRPLRETWEEDAEACWDRLYACAPIPVVPPPNQERMLAEVEKLVPEVEAAPAEAKEAVLAQFRRALRDALKAGVSSRDPRAIRICAPLAEHLDGPEFRALRRNIRTLRKDEADEAVEESTPSTILPADWRWWSRTRGRRALMVGGDPREPNRLRLKEAFGFTELDWEASEFRRNSLIAVRDRVRAGKVDLVIILGGFVGHDADEIILPACRERGVDWVHVDKGYGIVRLRRSIERFLDPGNEGMETAVP